MKPATRRLYREALGAAWLGLGVNVSLGLGKLLGGYFGDSFALLADSVNSLGDGLTSAVVVFALTFAQRPADAEHPYGHTRAEGVAATNVALLVMLSALGLAWESLRRWGAPHDAPPWWTLALAAANAAIKEALYQYKRRVGARTGSAAIVANAWDHRGDALCSLAVLAGLAGVRFGGAACGWADEAAALVVSAAIFWTGAQLFRTSASELLDPQARPELVARLRAAAGAVPGVRGVEKLFARKTGLEYLVDIHVEVDGQLTVAAGHAIGHRVKDALLVEFPELRDVLVHLEPHRARDGF